MMTTENAASDKAQSPLDSVSRVVFLCCIVVLAGLATWANSDLLGPRPFLFMDERITYDGVAGILQASSPSDWWTALADGADHRYGRIHYYLTSLFAAVPYFVFGEPGMVFAMRSAQVFLLLTAYSVLCLFLLRTWPARAIAMVGLGSLPFTAYYLTMPKPEPIQLLMLALFLVFAVREEFAFGWHWLFLGLAFGAKISTAPLCLVAAAAALLSSYMNKKAPTLALKQAGIAGVSFLAGLVVAVPILLYPNHSNLNTYLQWTFRGAGHGADSADVNVWTWIDSLLNQGSATNEYLSSNMAYLLLGAVCIFLICQFVLLLRPKTFHVDWLGAATPWIILAFGFAMTLPIIIFVKRLWGSYLHIGEVLILLALLMMAERTFLSVNNWTRQQRLIKSGILLFAAILVVSATTCWPKALGEYRDLAKRSNDPEHIRQARVFEETSLQLEHFRESLLSKGALENGQLVVAYDPILYLPSSSEILRIIPVWGYAIPWEEYPHVMVLDYQHTLSYLVGDTPIPEPSSALRIPIAAAANAYKQYVGISDDDSKENAYVLVGLENDGIGVLVQQALKEHWSAPYERYAEPVNR